MTTLREAAEASLDALKMMRQKYGEYDCQACDHADVAIIKLCAALEEPVQEPVAASLKRGTTGRCTRKVCECEKEGLGLECIHLEPVVDGYPLWSGIPKSEPVQEFASIPGTNVRVRLPVQEPVAWRTFDGEGGYDYRAYEDNEDYAAEWAKRNPRHVGWVEPLYATPPQALKEDSNE